MSKSVDQLFVNQRKQSEVVDALRHYCLKIGKQRTRHRRFALSGINQIKNTLIKQSRRFVVSGSKKNWVVIWERVDYTSFGDPEIARYLSRQLMVVVLFISFDESYNIWCFQKYFGGEIVDEVFLPEEYFIKESENVDFESYGTCYAQAKKVDRKYKLPYFLEDPTTREEGEGLPRGFKEVKFRIK